jgi:hypothetical protein
VNGITSYTNGPDHYVKMTQVDGDFQIAGPSGVVNRGEDPVEAGNLDEV